MRKLKATLAVLALAISVGVATSASANAAQGTFTADSYPAGGHGEATGPNTFTSFANVTCNEVTGNGTLNKASTTLTIEYIIKNCKLGGTNPATTTMNGCDTVLHVGEGAGHEWPATADLVCPPGKVGELHSYSTTPHGSSTCTVTFFPANGLSGVTLRNVTGSKPSEDTIQAEGLVTNISTQTHGSCSFGFTLNSTEGALHIAIKVTGTNEIGAQNGIRID